MYNLYTMVVRFTPSIQKIPIFLHYRDQMFPYYECNSTIIFDVLIQLLSIFLIIEFD